MKELEVEGTRRKIKYPAAAMLVNSNGSIKLVMSTLIFDWENKKRYQVFIERFTDSASRRKAAQK